MNKGTVGMSIGIISQVISVLPNDVVAVYGMYRSIGKEPIYIGQTTTLKDRLSQPLHLWKFKYCHWTKRIFFQPQLYQGIHWWTHLEFKKIVTKQAAELIAFEQFNPIIQSQISSKKTSCHKVWKSRIPSTNDRTFSEQTVRWNPDSQFKRGIKTNRNLKKIEF